jgi:hypothetical protein
MVILLSSVGLAAVFFFRQPAKAEASDLMRSPAELPGLATLTWTRQSSSGDGDLVRETWTGVNRGGDKDRVSYLQEVKRANNSLTADWDYSSSIRINYERDMPGRVFDVETDLPLHAAELDIFCVDTDNRYSRGEASCGEWVYWARYDLFSVYVQVYGSKLDKAAFLWLVKELDEKVAKSLG